MIGFIIWIVGLVLAVKAALEIYHLEGDIIKKVFVNGEPITDVELKELIGHTKVEVAGGFIVGVLTAMGFIFLS